MKKTFSSSVLLPENCPHAALLLITIWKGFGGDKSICYKTGAQTAAAPQTLNVIMEIVWPNSEFFGRSVETKSEDSRSAISIAKHYPLKVRLGDCVPPMKTDAEQSQTHAESALTDNCIVQLNKCNSAHNAKEKTADKRRPGKMALRT